jgi:uncharacterized membrane protein
MTRARVVAAGGPALILIAMATMSITPPAVRVAVALVLMLLVPGAAIVRHLRLEDVALQVGVAVAMSVTVQIIVAEMMLLVGHWNVNVAVDCIAIASAALFAVPPRVRA